MASQSDIVQQMLAALLVAEPSLDTSIGSPVRSILDVVSEQIAEAYADQYLLNYGTNVYTKTGSDLDNYVAQFGFTRLPGVRATGSITFSRTSAASADVYIGAGTQVTDSATPPNIFNTLTPVILAANTTSCSVPIQAQVAGTSGNVAANTIVNVTTLSMGFSSLTNPSGLTGGTNPESDDQLRARFIATVFRALTGTSQMFEAVGLEDPDVSQCNVVGATKTFVETVNIVSGSAISSVTDLAYYYPNTSVFGTDIVNGNILTPGVDYTVTTDNVDPTTFDPTVVNNSTGGSYADIGVIGYALVANTAAGSSTLSDEISAATSTGNLNSMSVSWTNTYAVGDINPILTIDIYVDLEGAGLVYLTTVDGSVTSYLDTGSITPGGTAPTVNQAALPPRITTTEPDGIYDFQFDYLPSTSRNSPANGVTNRIDVYVNGTRPIEATQDAQWTSAYPFTRNAQTAYDVTQFQRLDGSNPKPGNYFVPFAYSPIINAALSGTIIVSGHTYSENVDFWTVNDTTAFGLGPLSRAGVEWRSSSNGASFVPTTGAAMNLDYSFNQIPQSVQTGIQNWRLVGTDVQVHQAKILNLNFYLGLILTSASYSQPTILAQIQTTISNYLSSLTFNSVVQVSEVLALVQGLPGVVAVRFLNSGDDTSTTYPVNPQWASGDYAIQSVNDVNAVLHTYADTSSPSRAVDVFLDDDTLASLANVYIKLYANNSFGAV